MGFKCGIVGLPNVGKSTLFNALTKASIAAENYPFCTIEPNIGVVPVPDARLDKIAAIAKSKKIIPTTVNFVDIAGLVAGASQGEGLGNKFLSHIRETQAIAEVVRCFEDENIVHVAGKVNPNEDADVIHTELILADLETVDKALHKVGKTAKSGNKDAVAEQAVLTRAKAHLNNEKPLRTLDISEKEQTLLYPLHLLTSKPILYIANVSEDGLKDNPHLTATEELAAKENAVVVPICAALEAELAELSDEEETAFLAELGLPEPGLHRLIRAGHDLLGLHTYFTAGPKEARAWTIPLNATAQEAAGVIHTDFAKGFIRAEVIAYEDYIKYDGEHGAKEAGRLRLEGKDYIVQDGDVMHFRFNV